jgi:ectoine hydroxylase-related dioxygenase (phytanoyl-CoA dioxygenase family)
MNRSPLRPIDKNDVEAYARDGVVCLRNVFDRDWIEMLEPIARRIAAGEDLGMLPHRPGSFMTHVLDEFRELAFNSPLGEACGRVMESKEVRFFIDQIFAKEPHSTSKTIWHNDRAGWPFTGVMVPSFWMPLTPITKENCLETLAGSHTQDVKYWNSTANSRQMVKLADRTNLPDGEAIRNNENFRILSWDLEPGDALLLHPWVLHYSAGNPSDDWRIAISIRPIGDDIRWDPRPECVNLAGVSFDEMIPGEKPQGPIVPLIWSEDGRSKEGASFPRGFMTNWDRSASERLAKSDNQSHEDFIKEHGGFSSVAAVSISGDY